MVVIRSKRVAVLAIAIKLGLYLFLYIPNAIYTHFWLSYVATFGEKLKNKVVVITGATTGIGAALARELFHSECRLILCAKNDADLNRLKSHILATAVSSPIMIPVVFHLDVADVGSLTQKCSEILNIFGRVDVLIHNASTHTHCGDIVEVEARILRRVMEVNFFGAAAVTKNFVPAMQANNSGQIVFLSSIMGRMGLPGSSTYCVAHHAVQAYADSLRAEVACNGINVLSIALGCNNHTNTGWFDTDDLYAAMEVQRLMKARFNESMISVSQEQAAMVYVRRFLPPAFFKFAEVAANWKKTHEGDDE